MKMNLDRGLFASGHGQHLTAFVVAAGRAGHMSGDRSAALRAGFESWGAPAVRSLTEALTAFGLSAFWIGHVLKGSLFQFIESVPNSVICTGHFL